MRATLDFDFGIRKESPDFRKYIYREDDPHEYFVRLEQMRAAQVAQYVDTCEEPYTAVIVGRTYEIETDTYPSIEVSDKYVILELDENKNVIAETIIYREPTSKLTSSIVDAIKAVMA